MNEVVIIFVVLAIVLIPLLIASAYSKEPVAFFLKFLLFIITLPTTISLGLWPVDEDGKDGERFLAWIIFGVFVVVSVIFYLVYRFRPDWLQ